MVSVSQLLPRFRFVLTDGDYEVERLGIPIPCDWDASGFCPQPAMEILHRNHKNQETAHSLMIMAGARFAPMPEHQLDQFKADWYVVHHRDADAPSWCRAISEFIIGPVDEHYRPRCCLITGTILRRGDCRYCFGLYRAESSQPRVMIVSGEKEVPRNHRVLVDNSPLPTMAEEIEELARAHAYGLVATSPPRWASA